METKSLQKLAHSRSEAQKWTSRIDFDISEAGDGTKVVNLMDGVKNNGSGKVFAWEYDNIIFPPSRYPATNEGYEKLYNDIARATTNCLLTRQRVERDKNTDGELLDPHLPPIRWTVGCTEHRSSDKRESNKKDRKRKTSSHQPEKGGECCTMFFTIHLFKADPPIPQGWYLKGGYGNAQHLGHDQLFKQELLVRTSTLTESERRDITSSFVHGSSGTAISAFCEKTNIMLSAQQVFYVVSKDRQSAYSESRLSDQPEKLTELTSAERLLHELKIDEECSYIGLFFEFQETTLLAEKGKGRPSKESTSFKKKKEKERKPSRIIAELRRETSAAESVEVQLDDEQHQEIESCYGHMRDNMEVGSKLLLGIAWVKGNERHLFELFPELMVADVTAGTNNEKRPLFLIVGRDSNHRIFTALRAFLPSECKWVFDWLWNKVVPRLLGPENVNRTELILTDGDSNIYGPLDACLQVHYPRAITGLCTFHLVTQTLEKLPFMLKGTQDTTDIIYIFKCWVFSWMRHGGVETVEEFEDSLSRLQCWLQNMASAIVSDQSQSSTKACFHEDKENSNYREPSKQQHKSSVETKFSTVDQLISAKKYNATRLQEFLTSKLLPLRNKWLYVLRTDHLGMGETTTSRAEASNSIMKHLSTDKVRPSMSLDSSATTMSRQSSVSVKKLQKAAMRDANTRPLWTDSDTAQHLVESAEILGREQMRLSVAYSLALVDAETIFCRRHTPADAEQSDPAWMPQCTNETEWEKQHQRELRKKIPTYLRTRTLKIKTHGVDATPFIYCDCKYFDQFGVVCRHVCAVLGTVRLEHFHPRNLRTYRAHYKRPNYDEFTAEVQSMVQTKLPGPVLTEADLQRVQRISGRTYPAFHGHESTHYLEFYTEMKDSQTPMLACQEGAEPAKMCEDDGDGIASFVTGNQRPGMLSQDERLTQEAQQSAAKWSKNSGKAYAEMQPYVKEIANIVDAEPELLRQVLTGLHNILGDVRDKAAKTRKQVGTLAGSIASSNLATDTRKIFKRMKGSHEPVLPQAKTRNRSHPCFSRVVLQPRKKRKEKRENKLQLASPTVPPPAGAVNSEEVSAAKNVIDLLDSDDEPEGVSTMGDGSAVVCEVNGANPHEPRKGGEDIRRCHLEALRRQGMMIEGCVVRAYLGALVRPFYNLGVRRVGTYVWRTWLRTRSWAAVEESLVSDGTRSGVDWKTDRVIFVPIFVGSPSGGHFSLLVIDRTQYEPGVFIYFDSYPAMGTHTANELKQELTKWPFWVQGRSVFLSQVGRGQAQAPGSNDCGILTCLYACAFLLGLLSSKSFEGSGDDCKEGLHYTIIIQMASAEKMDLLGRHGRAHIESAIFRDRVEFTDVAVAKGIRMSVCFT